ncbi:predicted protein [Nematostella vectensis]|uniref:Amino acid transporter transmembrane domain-containing protein n=1 Tax=Nematostella vectensis TaxID=45351 RepID=A7RJA4_NEMVE|nr:predicted protein [Nematostella vectensis]|eukprot:XP_001640706.1 predicted protein [Nematostella vectensis]
MAASLEEPEYKKKKLTDIPPSGLLTCHAIRLKPGEELVSGLKRFVSENDLGSAFVLTCVGSVRSGTIRLANAAAGSSKGNPNEDPWLGYLNPSPPFLLTLEEGSYVTVEVSMKIHSRNLTRLVSESNSAFSSKNAKNTNPIETSDAKPDTNSSPDNISVVRGLGAPVVSRDDSGHAPLSVTQDATKLVPERDNDVCVLRDNGRKSPEVPARPRQSLAELLEHPTKKDPSSTENDPWLGYLNPSPPFLLTLEEGSYVTVEVSMKIHSRNLVRTISGGGHLHVSLGDKEGQVIGGHVMGNMIIFTTAEVVIAGTPFAISVVTFSYVAHGILPTIEENMTDRTRFNSMLAITYAFCAVLRTFFAINGFFSFYGNIHPVISNSLPANSAIHVTVNALLVAYSILCYPFLAVAAIQITERSIIPKCTFERIPSKVWYVCARVLITVITVAIALLVPHFAALIAISGNLGAMTALIFPTLFHLRLKYEELSVWDIILDFFVLVLGIAMFVIGSAIGIRQLLK